MKDTLPNPEQKKVLSALETIAHDNSILRWFKNNKKGAYIYGSVGSGKTFILKKLYDSINDKKIFFHYHSFLLFIHEKLRELGNKEKKIELLVSYLKSRYKHIIIDELEILDITDAMLIKEIIPKLCYRSVKIYFSTNIKPEKLYLDGIQRNSFIPFIDFIVKEFFVTELSSEVDYREQMVCKKIKEKYLVPNSKRNNQKLLELFDEISDGNIFDKENFAIYDRSFKVVRFSKEALVIDFNDFFTANSSTKDFEKITRTYKYIFVLNIREINHEERNVIKRFINFIDLLYVEKNILFLTSSVDIENIYKSGIYLKEFNRTKSRLKEIKNFKLQN